MQKLLFFFGILVHENCRDLDRSVAKGGSNFPETSGRSKGRLYQVYRGNNLGNFGCSTLIVEVTADRWYMAAF